jgi:hypothetical protein
MMMSSSQNRCAEDMDEALVFKPQKSLLRLLKTLMPLLSHALQGSRSQSGRAAWFNLIIRGTGAAGLIRVSSSPFPPR